MLDNMF